MMNRMVCTLALLAAFLALPSNAAPAPTSSPPSRSIAFDTDVSGTLPQAPIGATAFRVEGTLEMGGSFTAENNQHAPVPYWDARADVAYSIAGVLGLQIVQRCDYDGLEPSDGQAQAGPDCRTLPFQVGIPCDVPWSTPVDQYVPLAWTQTHAHVHEWWGPPSHVHYPWSFESDVHVRLRGRVTFEF